MLAGGSEEIKGFFKIHFEFDECRYGREGISVRLGVETNTRRLCLQSETERSEIEKA